MSIENEFTISSSESREKIIDALRAEGPLPLPVAEIPQYMNFCCGCARQSTAKTDCCFCHEETDMGAMRHWCSFIRTDCEFICEKCEYFMSKSEAVKVLKGIVLERIEKTSEELK